MPLAVMPASPAIDRINVMQGEACVSGAPDAEFTTVLGSCVATCLFDPELRLGGMNHFLLAEPGAGAGALDVHYGVYLMEVLINRMLSEGAVKQRLRAHLYGGAQMHAGMARIGEINAGFARRFLVQERIPLLREDLGGVQARRIDFRPASGQVRCRRVENTHAPSPVAPRAPLPDAGEVELF